MKAKVFISPFDKANLGAILYQALAWVEWEKAIPRDAPVFIKPNLTYPKYKPGVTTSPEFLEEVIVAVKSRTANVYVGESDGGYRGWPAELAFAAHNLPEICRRQGVKLINLSKMPTETVKLAAGNREVPLELPALLTREIQALITVPVPKVHAITRFSGAIKNQWGCIPNNMRLRYHPLFNDCILGLNRLIKTRLAIMDGTYMLDECGPMVGKPVRMNLAVVSRDIRAADLTCCDIMRLDANKVWHLHSEDATTRDSLETNCVAETFARHTFKLHRPLRSWVVVFAFNRPWAIRLIWDSKIGDLLHRIMYAITGNPTRDDIQAMKSKYQAHLDPESPHRLK
ncbi:MAG: DUF362 domain-containing protein [Deltaproteobacteria bacterium]|nr:MAG: DUF362 domain-containing protein [Deltaproteobacteria bacterium]